MSKRSDSSELLIPIQIDALLVGYRLPPGEMFQWTNLAPDFAKLGTGYFFGPELDIGSGNPFSEAASLEQGIHLHFRLPRAFTHGSQEGADDVTFPVIPNRWLVQRFGGSDKLTYKAWLIESDVDADETLAGLTWPTFHSDKPLEFRRIGACRELTGPLTDQNISADPKITAVGLGNPAFSAYYPACRGVLGFYDSVKGVSEGTRLSYLVTGWYSHEEDDPLVSFFSNFRQRQSGLTGDLTEEQQLQQFTELQQWADERGLDGIAEKTEDKPPRFKLPSRILCHGLVRGIDWMGTSKNYMQTSQQGASISQPTVFPANPVNHEKAYTLAVGNTSAEALAAMLVSKGVDQDLLTALQSDMLSQTVTASDIQYSLHERRFSGVHGGTIFDIRQEADESSAIRQAEPKSAGGEPLPSSLQLILNQLNEKQKSCDQLSRVVEDYRWQVYALWYLLSSEQKAGVTEQTQARVDLLDKQLLMAKQNLKTVRSELDSAMQERDKIYSAKKDRDEQTGTIIDELIKHQKLQPDGNSRLDAGGKPELKYRLETSVASPFLKTSDPAIAISGPAMQRHNTQHKSSKLMCRIGGEEVTGFNLQVPAGGPVTVDYRQLMDGLFSSQDQICEPDAIHAMLLGEALLLDELYAPVIAGMASSQHVDLLSTTVKALQNPASTSAQANPPEAKNALIGNLPDRMALFNWKDNPWIPLFMVWEVSWQSDYLSHSPEIQGGESLPVDLVTKRWNLNCQGNVQLQGKMAGGDLMLKEKATDIDMNIVESKYDGYTILTPSASKDLAEKLETLNESHPLVGMLKNMHVQSQMIDGFNAALTLQKPGMQLPPLDFSAWYQSRGTELKIDPIYTEINTEFDSLEQRDAMSTAPRISDDPFYPIRAGRLKITKLSIVDAFGQTLKLPVDKINESAQNAWQESMLRRAHSCVVESSSASTQTSINRSYISLRPRFTLPMHLQFKWATVSAGQVGNGGPVCGWVVPNHLEKSLTIYSTSGIPLGGLQKKLDIPAGTSVSAFYWVDVPGVQNNSPGLQGQTLSEQLAKIIEDPHLRYFCEWVLKLNADEGGVFSLLIDNSMGSVDQRVPEEDPGVSVLVGRSLALVRASLQFESAGLPAERPELRPDFVQGMLTATGEVRIPDTAGYQNVKWPLCLGDRHAGNDGLIGLFKCASSTADDVITSGRFYPTWGLDENISANNLFAAQDFEIDCVQPLQVTMLMDPQARVHATCGALPRTYIELPQETVSGAKRAREVFFQTAPLLGQTESPQMPIPSDDYGEWSWAYRPDVTHWKLDPSIVEATDRGGFTNTWPAITEGWLKLAIAPVKVLSFWVREGNKTVVKGTNIHLAWSLQGAESLTLEGAGMETLVWNSAPFPREYTVTVQADTRYRISAFAEGVEPSIKELFIRVAK